jgi:broad specificity phosphatase PhoE
MAGTFCGQSDPELNSKGRRQAARVADEVGLLGIGRIVASDLRRASRTAAAIGRHLDVDVEFEPGLREMDFGLWEGLDWQEVEERYPEQAARWLRNGRLESAPGGETYAAFTKRVYAAMARLLDCAGETTIAVVTHRGVMRYALARFFDFSEADAWAKTEGYGSVIVCRRAPDRGLTDCDRLPVDCKM